MKLFNRKKAIEKETKPVEATVYTYLYFTVVGGNSYSRLVNNDIEEPTKLIKDRIEHDNADQLLSIESIVKSNSKPGEEISLKQHEDSYTDAYTTLRNFLSQIAINVRYGKEKGCKLDEKITHEMSSSEYGSIYHDQSCEKHTIIFTLPYDPKPDNNKSNKECFELRLNPKMHKVSHKEYAYIICANVEMIINDELTPKLNYARAEMPAYIETLCNAIGKISLLGSDYTKLPVFFEGVSKNNAMLKE